VLQATKQYVPFKGYAQSKLANVMAAAELSRRSATMHANSRSSHFQSGRPVCSTSVHPGLINTPLARAYFENDWLFPWVRPIAQPIVRMLEPFGLLEPFKGACTVAFAALAPEATVDGKYVSDGRVTPSAAAALDRSACGLLWSKSCELAGMQDPMPLVSP
jgi:NAD(P)-dependent dehydrogenase (short-subunit alcohol dehydrogenase family)